MIPKSNPANELYGIARIAAEAGVPVKRASYLAQSRQVDPAGEVGGAFVYGKATALRMISVLRLAAESRAQAGPRQARPTKSTPGPAVSA